MSDLLARLRDKVSQWASAEDHDSRVLRDQTAASGCELIIDAVDRSRVTLQGTVQTIALRPRGGVPALEAELYDGSAEVTLVWLGRRTIVGIDPGRTLRVEGRIAVRDGARLMYNPTYELRS